MPTITFENGQSVTTDKMPTPQDVEHIANHLGIQASSSSSGDLPRLDAPQPESSGPDASSNLDTSSSMPTTQDVDQMIKDRKGLASIPANFSSKGQGALTVLRALATPFQVAESIPADIALAAQRGNQGGFQQLPQNLLADITGQRAAQMGDVYRGSGIPGLSSEPVASTLGMVAAMAPKIPIPGAALTAKGLELTKVAELPNAAAFATNLVGNEYAKTISPVVNYMTDAAKKFGSPIVAGALNYTTTKPTKMWQQLIDNPNLGSRKYVEDLNKAAAEAYTAKVDPVASNTSNRVVLDSNFKKQLNDVGVYVKPQGMDDATFNAALTGDQAANESLARKVNLDKLEKAANAGDRKAFMEAIDSAGASAGRTMETGRMESVNSKAPTDILEKSEGLGSMNQAQQSKIVDWYKRLASKEDISVNDARKLSREMNEANKSYYQMAQEKGTGITGASASTFNTYTNKLSGLLRQQVGTQYPEVGQALDLYHKASEAKSIHKVLTDIQPHAFRAFVTRMMLGAAGVPGGAAYGIGAAATSPAFNTKVIRGLSRVAQVYQKTPSAVLSPLLRQSGNQQ